MNFQKKKKKNEKSKLVYNVMYGFHSAESKICCEVIKLCVPYSDF